MQHLVVSRSLTAALYSAALEALERKLLSESSIDDYVAVSAERVELVGLDKFMEDLDAAW